MRAFIAVDVVLVLAFVGLFLMTRSGADEPERVADAPPASKAAATSESSEGESPDATGTPAEDDTSTDPGDDEPTVTGDDAAQLFASPSGNIVCSISEDAASCSIAELSDEGLVEDEECTGTVGHVVRVTADGESERPCVTGAPPGAAPAATPVLEYEDSTSVFDFTCTSSRSGIICRHDGTGHGFSIARAGSSLF